ncbi:copper amine oxidase N-terminal domain-containing protein [Salsuginibacillus kocurii]|uniref:copper amine oxidase N-terminal domain-containing protein n=1 Tax=Salsuginibacillus kocurii TaxID=427078 RepID=UPI000379E100|nr:copper amine oxidase N-terminal domain-containing protein [Salsuginibacillus kocurii]
MRKVLLLLIAATLALVFFAPQALASTDRVQVFVEGEELSFDIDPVIKDGVTLVEFRGIFEKLDMSVGWNNETRTVTGESDDTEIELTLGNDFATVNGSTETLGVPAQTMDGRTLVPLRFISESSGADVFWDNENRTITIEKPSSYNSNKTGDVSGTITWQYNDYVGTRGDVNADVYLIPSNFDYEGVNETELSLFAMGIQSAEVDGLHLTTVNGNGEYQLNNIPIGEYVLVVSSENTTRDLTQPVSDYVENTVNSLLGNEVYSEFELFNLKRDKHTIEIIEVQEDRTIDYSHDFGYTFI